MITREGVCCVPEHVSSKEDPDRCCFHRGSSVDCGLPHHDVQASDRRQSLRPHPDPAVGIFLSGRVSLSGRGEPVGSVSRRAVG